MHYTLHQLKVFAKVCELKSITKASEHLHLTQPAVSIQLKKLQDQFDIPLTEVIGRQLYVTEFGEQIVIVCNRLLKEAELIDSTTSQYKGLLTGKVHISSVSTGKYVIPYFLSEFSKLHPQVALTIDVTNKNLVVESLLNNRTDFALVSVLPDFSLESIELMDNQLRLFCGQEYFDRLEGLSIKSLEELPLIFREQGSATRKAMEAFLNENKIRPKRMLELATNEAVKQAVNAGLGLSIMPVIGLRNELSLGTIKEVPIEGLPITTSWNLVHAKGKMLTPAAKVMLNHIKTNKQQFIDRHF